MADAHWIEHAKLKKGAYGHHSAAQIEKDSKKGGLLGKRATLAKTFAKMRKRHASLSDRATHKMYGSK
jgi:hypothetical protein